MDASPMRVKHPHMMPAVKQVTVGCLENQRKRLRTGMTSVCLFTFLKAGAVNPLRKMITRSQNFVSSRRSVGILGVQVGTSAKKSIHGPNRTVRWIWPFVLHNYRRYMYDAIKVPVDTKLKRPGFDNAKWDSLTIHSWLDPEERRKNFMMKRYIETAGRLQMRLHVAFTKRHLPSNMAYLHFFRIPVEFSLNTKDEEEDDRFGFLNENDD
eukprot:TRINITY_DN6618_c0_g1_i1.p2 TRINITY_DN6618_c0_g1~~TRINITY_DN6618_c0_g1_i1.p2  ORF type:complete len:234 (-),score=63.40 TRINITY_DN6618_c0_g1_i1:1253-1882(-)